MIVLDTNVISEVMRVGLPLPFWHGWRDSLSPS
jgi:hypothetical protein